MSFRASSPLRPVPREASGEVRVLVVDDSAFMRHVITRELTSDARVRVVGGARDGLEAINMARDLKPDVVTLDIEMPSWMAWARYRASSKSAGRASSCSAAMRAWAAPIPYVP